MKRTNRLLALLLCAAMLLCTLAACGSTATETAETTPAAETAAAATTEAGAPAADAAPAASQPAEDTAPAEQAEEPAEAAPADLGNPFDLTFPGADSAELSFSNVYSLPLSDGETVTWMRSAPSLMGPLAALNYTTFQDFPYIQKLQEVTGVNIEFVELDFFTMTEKMNIYIASGDYADLISSLSYTGDLNGALGDDIIYDLTDWLADYAPNYDYMIHSDPDVTNIFTVDGKVLAFMSPYDSFTNNQGLVIRKDWLEELGLDVPTTYDEMYDTLTAFRDAYACETPIFMNQQCYIQGLTVGYDVAAFAADGTATELPYFVDNGTVKCSLIEDGFRDYLQEMNRWYEAGLFDADFISIQYDPRSDYLDGQITTDQMGVWCTSGEGVDSYSVPVTCVPALTVEKGGMDHITSTSLTVDSQVDTVVTTCCDNVELTMKLLDYFYSLDGITMLNYGQEGETYEVENGTPVFTDLVVNNEYDVSVATMLRALCGYSVIPSPMLRYRTAAYNSALVTEAWDVWSSNLDGSMCIPDNVSMTIDEAEQAGYYATDVQTYAVQMVPQFILGVVGFDQWDSYVEDLKTMGIETCIALEQAAYDRSISR
jgi:putative aldouronate transport system substrate-binding protein